VRLLAVSKLHGAQDILTLLKAGQFACSEKITCRKPWARWQSSAEGNILAFYRASANQQGQERGRAFFSDPWRGFLETGPLVA
jgi:hypothetical protein